jgi:CheY-like chemotaxis protein
VRTRLKRGPRVPDCRNVSASYFILLVEDERTGCDALATSLVRLGVEPILVENLEEAAEIVTSGQYVIAGVLLPSYLPGTDIRNAMKGMQRHEPMLHAMAYGKAPEPAQRILLQQAGVLFALWDGYDEGVLRFQINRFVSKEGDHALRDSQRAPTHTPIRMLLGGREKEGMLYSISEGGCFVETKRASMEGAQLQLIFRLVDVDYSLDGVVAFSNVPGNLQRPNLPLGMGVRFESMPDEARWQLADFIRDRMDALEV